MGQEGLMMNDLMVHVRWEGKSWDWPAGDLDIGDGSTDNQIRENVARRLGQEQEQLGGAPVGKLSNFAVDRTAEGFTLRPEAIFG